MTTRGKMECHGMTDRGTVRSENEDQFLIADLNKSMLVHSTSLGLDDRTRLFGATEGHVLLVADGMGGHQGGRIASTIAVDTAVRYLLTTLPWFFSLDPASEEDLAEELRSALEQCDRSIQEQASNQAGGHKMGTTLTMAYLLWPRLYVVHVGDSRCSVIRDGRLQQVTTDHTLAQAMVEEGALEPEQAEGSRFSHILWNALGGSSEDVAPSVYKVTLEIGDVLLLHTDGLNLEVEDENVVRLINEADSAKDACEKLVEAAKQAGGRDNVTTIVARFHNLDRVIDESEQTFESETAEPLERPPTRPDLDAPHGARNDLN